MRRSYPTSGRSGLVAVFLATAACALSACSGGSGSAPATSLPGQTRAAAKRASSPNTIAYSYQTVDGNTSSAENRITGISDSTNEIVGNYGNTNGCPGVVSDPVGSFTSTPPYTSFAAENLPNANGTYLSSINLGAVVSVAPGTILAGYVCQPKSLDHNAIWGLIAYQNITSGTKSYNWTIIQEIGNEGTQACNVMELSGVNDSNVAAGLWKTGTGAGSGSCGISSMTVAGPDETFTKPTPLSNWTSFAATGINNAGALVGWDTTSSNIPQGWYLSKPSGTYATISIPGATSTQPYAINNAPQNYVVGTYKDSTGQHGFIVFNPGGATLSWEQIDEPKANKVTVVSGINDSDYLTGWYVGTDTKTHGFVATVVSTPAPARPGKALLR